VSAVFQVFLSNKAKKQLRDLQPAEIKSRAMDALARLEQEPIPYKEYELRKVEGREETYRIRLSSFRIVYKIKWQEKIISVAKIERRSDNTYD